MSPTTSRTWTLRRKNISTYGTPYLVMDDEIDLVQSVNLKKCMPDEAHETC